MSRVVTVIGGVSVLALWAIIAMSVEFPLPNTSQGWLVVPNGFLFGFMLIPKVFGQLVLIGASALL